MRTGSGNRQYYNRTTGSRTARLYSRRTAQKMNRIYQNDQASRIRSFPSDRYDQKEQYNEYYDVPRRSSSRKKSKNSRISTIAVAVLIVVVLAVVITGLSMLKPGSPEIGIAKETVPEASGTGTELQTQPTEAAAVEESDPPVIYGVIPIVVYSGHSVSYKQGVYVEDDTDAYPSLEIDNEDVDLSTPGRYFVSYIARDKDGNVTREFTSVTVLEGTDLVSDEEIFALADLVLDSILTEDMNDVMKCLKVYEYLHAIGYVDEVHSEDWMQNAYWMLTLREGDCFCYYSAARLLLSRLGYEVMEVRNNNNYVHYWCLVSIDGGSTWWHFDPTCWSWGEDGILCLVSDSYLSTFTRRHITGDGRLIHAWDKTKYPATPEEDFWTDDDRSVIYEGGLISPVISYEGYEDLWENDGWEEYDITYEDYYTVPDDTGYDTGYDVGYEDYYTDPGYTEDPYAGEVYAEDLYAADAYAGEYTEDIYSESYDVAY